MKRPQISSLLGATSASLLLIGLTIGCDKSPTQPEESATINLDIAESVAGTVSENNGGMVDQMADISELTGGSALTASPISRESLPSFAAGASASYDAASGTWTVQLDRERGIPGALYYAHFTRTYTYRFLNSAGVAQQFYITGNDTAYSIEFNVVEGTGFAQTPRWNHTLTDLSGSFVATGTNTYMIAVNGSYFRGAIDTLRTARAVRSSDHDLTMNFANVTFPRGSRQNCAAYISGTISGTYNAQITWLSGRGYAERSVSRSFEVTFGTGNVQVEVGGDVFLYDVRTSDVM